MLNSLLSGDYPRSRVLSVMLVVVVLALAFAPFLFEGAVAYRTASTILLFIVLVASYDILLGYTAIVSFAHTVFYGIGAYSVAITLQHMEPTWGAIALATVIAVVSALVVALVIGLFSLRVKAIFFALTTLAIATGVMILVSKLYAITGGEDGLNVHVPLILDSDFHLLEICDPPGSDDCRVAKWPGFNLLGYLTSFNLDEAIFDVRMNGKLVMYYSLFFICSALFLIMLRVMNSPFGRVCQAIRENEFRAEALGYRTVYYKTINVCLAGVMAALAGVLTALSVKFVNPGTALGFEIMVNILLINVIGGMGTLYGAIIGSAFFIIAQNYLQKLMSVLYDKTEGIPVLHEFMNPTEWFMWLGILFVLSVYFFPKGLVGQLRIWAAERRARKTAGNESQPATTH